MSTGLHVIFGAGQIGSPLARLLLDAGKRVRIAKRSAGGVPPGAEVHQGRRRGSGILYARGARRDHGLPLHEPAVRRADLGRSRAALDG
jgi:nucleoside-diphosphate-sugar epimerase